MSWFILAGPGLDQEYFYFVVENKRVSVINTIRQILRMHLKSSHRSLVKMKWIILLSVFGLSLRPCVSQRAQTLKLQEIPQRKVRKFMVSKKIDQMPDFSSIHASWKKDINESDYCMNEKTFFLNYTLSDVWGCYRHVDFARAWNGKSVRFGLLISKYSNSAIYSNSSFFPEIDTGQVYFLNLKVMKGLINIPVAFEITNIDEELKMVEFSYIEGNTTRGKQIIRFYDNGDGRTRILHSSFFKSESSFRDHWLYPYFHKKFIGEFHMKMRQIISKKDNDHEVIVLK